MHEIQGKMQNDLKNKLHNFKQNRNISLHDEILNRMEKYEEKPNEHKTPKKVKLMPILTSKKCVVQI